METTSPLRVGGPKCRVCVGGGPWGPLDLFAGAYRHSTRSCGVWTLVTEVRPAGRAKGLPIWTEGHNRANRPHRPERSIARSRNHCQSTQEKRQSPNLSVSLVFGRCLHSSSRLLTELDLQVNAQLCTTHKWLHLLESLPQRSEIQLALKLFLKQPKIHLESVGLFWPQSCYLKDTYSSEASEGP